MLAEIEVKIDEFEQRFNAYMRELGIEELDGDCGIKRSAQPSSSSLPSRSVAVGLEMSGLLRFSELPEGLASRFAAWRRPLRLDATVPYKGEFRSSAV
ncbi:MAG: hypothetical protein M3302_03350 [Actinomycetota bacterium]|nr:hypothetical protein [Actinomycetota bacterium]